MNNVIDMKKGRPVGQAKPLSEKIELGQQISDYLSIGLGRGDIAKTLNISRHMVNSCLETWKTAKGIKPPVAEEVKEDVKEEIVEQVVTKVAQSDVTDVARLAGKTEIQLAKEYLFKRMRMGSDEDAEVFLAAYERL